MSHNIRVVGANAGGTSGGGGSPTGAAGGDLTGSYPNPTIGASKVTSSNIVDGAIVNADVNASAAIAYSKLALTGAVLNADLAGSIAASKITGTAVTAADTGTVTSTMILDATILGGDLSATIAIPSAATATTQTAADNSTKVATTAYVDAKERTLVLGKAGAIGATETNGADFPIAAPYALTMKRMKVTLGTACSGAMTVQLRKAAGPITTPPAYSDVTSFIVTFSSGNVLAVVDPADLTLAEGDFVNFSVGTGSGANLLVELICI